MSEPTQGPALFGRVCSIQLGTTVPGINVSITGLRTKFSIGKSSTHEPNKIQLEVYNLSQNTRKQLRAQYVPIIVDAGYKNLHSQIFNGTVRAIEHVREGTEWVTKVTGGDGEKAYRVNRINQSWKPKTPASVILLQLAQATGLAMGNIPDVAKKGAFRKGMQVFNKGYISHGPAFAALNTLAHSLGYQLSSQDGVLQMVSINSSKADTAVALNQTSGLVGSPEVNERGLLKVTSLLNGSIYPKRQIKLQSNNFNGLYVAQAVTHKGDTHGKDWHTIALIQGLANPVPGRPTGGDGGE